MFQMEYIWWNDWYGYGIGTIDIGGRPSCTRGCTMNWYIRHHMFGTRKCLFGNGCRLLLKIVDPTNPRNEAPVARVLGRPGCEFIKLPHKNTSHLFEQGKPELQSFTADFFGSFPWFYRWQHVILSFLHKTVITICTMIGIVPLIKWNACSTIVWVNQCPCCHRPSKWPKQQLQQHTGNLQQHG